MKSPSRKQKKRTWKGWVILNVPEGTLASRRLYRTSDEAICAGSFNGAVVRATLTLTGKGKK